MSEWMVQEFTELFKRVKWPEDTRTTSEQRVIYERGLDVVNSYRGHPDILIEAMKLFIGSGSLPYAFAGTAIVMSHASYISDDQFDRNGMNAALDWLQKALKIAPDRPEINMVQAIHYLRMGRIAEAGKILEKIADQSPVTYHLCTTFVNYAHYKKDVSLSEKWFEQGYDLAQTDAQRLNILNFLAGTYLRLGLNDKALKAYDRILALEPKDPWAWHNASIILTNQKQYQKAYDYNQKALSIMPFGAAQHVEQQLKTKLGIKDKNATNQKESKNWFKKLIGG